MTGIQKKLNEAEKISVFTKINFFWTDFKNEILYICKNIYRDKNMDTVVLILKNVY